MPTRPALRAASHARLVLLLSALFLLRCGGGGGETEPLEDSGAADVVAPDGGGGGDVAAPQDVGEDVAVAPDGSGDVPGTPDAVDDVAQPADVPAGDGGPEVTTCPLDSPCNDHDPCTSDDRCTAGGVCAGTAYSCDDGLDCTEDACDGAGGCEETLALGACLIDGTCYVQGEASPDAPCLACLPATDPNAWSDNEGGSCEDGNQCTVGDRCESGTCVPGAGTLPCNDNDICNGVESCDPDDGCVAGTPLECVDANVCNGTETCDPMAGCQVGTPLACNDGDVCNGTETCDPTEGCQDGADLVCDDANACNGVETCHPTDGCQGGTAPVCDDNDVCNGVETCAPAVGCVSGQALSCDDGNDCTDDTCDALLGCRHTDRAGVCDDGNPCTAGGGTCQGGACVGAAPICPPGDFCSVGCDGSEQVWCLGADPYPLDCADYGADCGVVDDEAVCTCGDDFAPRCAGAGTLVVCEAGVLSQIDCGLAGGGCGIDGSGEAACRCEPDLHEPVCLDSGNLAVCGEDGNIAVVACGGFGGVCAAESGGADRCACGDDFAPSCSDAETQVFCSDGADGDLMLLDCAALGTTCGASATAEGCVCGAGSASACDADDTLYSCGPDGVYVLRDCVAEGGTCDAGDDGAATCVGPGCPGIPAGNVCEGDVLHSCADGWDVATDCSLLGMTCGLDPATGVNACRQTATTCGAVTEAGECRGSTVAWCQDGVLQQFDCGHYGASCGFWDEAQFFWCDCSDDTFAPGCYGDVGLADCRQDGWLEIQDCSDLGGWCGAGAGDGAACVGSGCDGETFLGRCEGDSIVWCENDLVLQYDCAGAGGVCAWDVNGTFYNCLASQPGCETVPAVGRCTRDVLETCGPEGYVVGLDCAESGRTCDWRDSTGGYTCVGCAGVPAEGLCAGATLQWCADDVVLSFDCSAWDTGCGDDAMGGKSCLCPAGEYDASCAGDTLVSCHSIGVLTTTDCTAIGGSCGTLDGGGNVCFGGGCGGETFEGRCQDGVLTWCENLLVHTVDCAAYGYACTLEADRGIYNCVPPHGECGDETAAGRCDGDELVYCSATGGFSEVVRKDCAELLKACGETSPGVFGCVEPSGCGDETFEGRCDGDVVVYCAEGQVQRADCASAGRTCGDVDGLMDCVESAAGSCGAVTFFGVCDGNTLTYCEGDTIRSIDCAAGDLVCGDDGVLGSNCIPPEAAGACDPACGAGFLCVGGMCRANGSQARDWTYLVYVAGDNNLSPAALGDIAEMEMVGTGPNVAVVVQTEFSTATEPPAELRDDTFRYAVPYAPAAGPDVAAIAAGRIGARNMGAPASLTEFIEWGVERYPAKRYALVLWNHGAGWMGGFQDETSGDDLSLAEIRDGIRAAGVFIDVVDFDACLMGMYEVAAELYDLAGYVVASEEVEPGCGNPYHTILGALAGAPGMGARAFATRVVDEYVAWYASDDVVPGCALDVTKSALDLSEALPFNGLVSAFANALRAEVRTRRATILGLLSATQPFHYTFYRDLADFAGLVAASDLSAETRQAAQQLADHITTLEGIVIRNGVLEQTGFKDLSGAYGVSIFAPDLVDAQSYPTLLRHYVDSLTFRQRQSAWSLLVESLHTMGGDSQIAVDGSFRISWHANEARTIPSDANLNLWLVEPGNYLYGPLFGTVTPNGYFSPESSVAGVSQESYTWASAVSPGSYLFFVIYDSNGPTHRIAWPEVTIELDGVAGYPQTLRRVDGQGSPLSMSMTNALSSPLDALLSGTLTEAEIEAIWRNEYSNIWMIPPVVIE